MALGSAAVGVIGVPTCPKVWFSVTALLVIGSTAGRRLGFPPFIIYCLVAVRYQESWSNCWSTPMSALMHITKAASSMSLLLESAPGRRNANPDSEMWQAGERLLALAWRCHEP